MTERKDAIPATQRLSKARMPWQGAQSHAHQVESRERIFPRLFDLAVSLAVFTAPADLFPAWLCAIFSFTDKEFRPTLDPP